MFKLLKSDLSIIISCWHLMKSEILLKIDPGNGWCMATELSHCNNQCRHNVAQSWYISAYFCTVPVGNNDILCGVNALRNTLGAQFISISSCHADHGSSRGLLAVLIVTSSTIVPHFSGRHKISSCNIYFLVSWRSLLRNLFPSIDPLGTESDIHRRSPLTTGQLCSFWCFRGCTNTCNLVPIIGFQVRNWNNL